MSLSIGTIVLVPFMSGRSWRPSVVVALARDPAKVKVRQWVKSNHAWGAPRLVTVASLRPSACQDLGLMGIPTPDAT